MKDIIKAEAGEYITRVQLYSASIDRARDRHRRLGFIAGATFGMGLKEKETERLKELLYKVVTMTHYECHPEYKKEAWNQFCKQNNIEP